MLISKRVGIGLAVGFLAMFFTALYFQETSLQHIEGILKVHLPSDATTGRVFATDPDARNSKDGSPMAYEIVGEKPNFGQRICSEARNKALFSTIHSDDRLRAIRTVRDYYPAIVPNKVLCAMVEQNSKRLFAWVVYDDRLFAYCHDN